MKKQFYFIFFVILSLQNIFGQANTPAANCANANPACAGGGFSYPNVHNSSSAETNTGINYSCLASQPDPNWFYLQIDHSGTLNFHIEQSSTQGGAANIDVDYICWGPFTSPTCGLALNGNIVGCSFSAASTENFTITNAVSGQYYMLLVTNYSNNAGYISISQTNYTNPNVPPPTGTGNTNCNIVCPLAIGPPVTICPGQSVNLTASVSAGTTYNWTSTVTGLTLPHTQTITVNQPGTYTVAVVKPGCVYSPASTTVSVSVAAPINTSPPALIVCNNLTFNLNNESAAILNGLDPSVYDIAYYHTASDASLGANPITNPTTYPGTNNEVIYAGVVDNSASGGGCTTTTSFVLQFKVCTLTANNSGPICQNGTFNLTASNPTAGYTYSWTGPNGFTSIVQNPTNVPAPTGAGPYVYTVTATGTPVLTATTTVVVNPLPTATISGTTAVCSGSGTNITFTGTANSVVTYTVNSGSNQTITLNGSGSATLPTGNLTTSTNYNLVSVLNPTTTCTQLVSGLATVTVTPSPTASILGTTTLCKGTGTNITFNGTPNAVVTYTVNSGTNQTITLSAAGTAVLPTGNLNSITIYTLISVTLGTCSQSQLGTATVTVNTLPSATIAGSTAVCSGTGATITFLGTSNAVVSYTVNNGSVATITLDATGVATLPTGNLTATTVYSLVSVLLNSTTCTQTQNGTATVTINPFPTATVAGTSTICSGTSSNFTFTGTPNAVVTYTINNGVNQAITLSNTGTATLSSGTVSTTTTCSLVSVTNPTTTCSQTQIGSAILSINTPLSVIISGTTAICSGTGTNITFTGTPNAVVTYTVNTGANQTITLSAAGIATLATGNLTATTTYNLVSMLNTTTACTQTQLGTATVTVNPLPTATISGTTSLCSGTGTNITFTGTPNATVTYTANGTATTISLDATGSATLATGNLTITTTYALTNVSLAATTCAQTQIGTAVVTVNPLPTVAISGTTALCSGTGSNITFTGTPNAVVTYTVNTGANQTITLSATGTATLPTGNLTATTTYELVSVLNTTTNCTQTQTGTAVVTVNPLPTVAISGTTALCSGIGTNITFTGTPNAVVTYTVNTGANQTIPLSATGTATLATGNLTATTTYNLVSVLNTTTACTQTQLGTATVTVNPLPTVVISGTTAICSGTGTNITFTGTPNATVTYTANGTAATISLDAAGTATLPTGNLTATTTYALTNVSLAATTCAQTQTGTAVVTVNPLPTVAISGTTALCSGTGSNITFTGTPNAVVTYTVNTGANQTITLSAAGTATLPTGNLTATTIYDLISVLNTTTTCTQTQLGTATVTVNPLPTVAISGTTAICSGTGTNITFTGTPNATVSYTTNGTVAPPLTLDPSGSAVLPTGNLTATTTYALTNVSLAATTCAQIQIGTAVVTVNPLPTVAISGTTGICYNTGTNITFTGTPNAVATYTVNTGANQTINLDAAGSATLPTGNLIATTIYDLISVLNTTTACTQTQLGTATVTVNPLPTVAISGTTAICSGTSTNITFTGTPNAVVTYTVNTGANQTISLSAAGTATLPTGNLTATTTYNLVSVLNTTTTCTQTQLGTATITIYPLPNASIAGSTSVCSGTGTTITFNGTPGATVNYTANTVAASITLDAQGAAVVSTGNLTATTSYALVSVSNPVTGCSQPQTGTALVTVIVAAVINTPTALQICDDNNDGFSIFDLHIKDNEITGGQAGLQVSYYETPTDAQFGSNAIVSNPYHNIVSWSQPIYVSVYNPLDPSCKTLTSLQLVVNPRPMANPTITDYKLCDTNGDGVEGFDLTTKTAEILNTQTGVAVTYYTTQVNATTGSSAINTAFLYVAASSTLWVRLENTLTHCYSVSSFNLVVNPLPMAIQPPTMNLCSAVGVTTAVFDLTANNSIITTGVGGVTVTDYATLSDAQAQQNPLPSLYTNTTNPQTIIVVVTNTTTGCSQSTTLQLQVTQGPTVNTPSPINYCDPNNDGFGIFDLTSVNTQIMGGVVPSSIQIKYYETNTDAQSNTSAISNPTAYPNIVSGSQTLYVGVHNLLSGCWSYVTLQLNVNASPQGVATIQLEACSGNTPGVSVFDLTQAASGILGSLDPTQNTLTYYVLESDAQAGVNALPLASITSYTSVTTTIYVRIENNSTHCIDVVPLKLVVNGLPSVPFPVPSYTLCDANNPGDEQEQFDLSSQIPAIIGNQTGVVVSFHLTLAEATQGINPLPMLYINTLPNPQTLFVRVENTTTHCYVTTIMDIRVEPLPFPIPQAGPIKQCDADGTADGVTNFNLDALVPDMLQGVQNSVITFYESLADAQSHSNPIATTNPYSNVNSPWSQTIYVRDENTLTHCFSVTTIQLEVNPTPIVPPATVLPDLTQCDQDVNPFNGFTSFDLTVQNPLLLGVQTGTGPFVITYHTSVNQAQNGTGPIVPASAFTNTSNPQTIWVRIVDSSTIGLCASVGSFQLIVNKPLQLTPPTPLALCDDGATTTIPTREFDITVKNNQILGANAALGYTISYYPSLADAQAAMTDPTILPIADPAHYTNVSNAQTLGVVVTSPAGCKSYTILDLRVLPLPLPMTTNIPDIVRCDVVNAPNLTELIDLTQNQTYIANNDPNLSFAYFTTQADAESNTNAIANPTAYETGTGTIYIRVMNSYVGLYGNCYVLAQEQIRINPLPIVQNTSYYQCETDNNQQEVFDLTSQIPILLDTVNTGQDTINYTVAFYTSQTDAQSGTNAIGSPSNYTNTSNPQMLYVAVTNNLTGCVNISLLSIKVEQAAVISTAPSALLTCDDDATNDGIHVFDLTTTVQVQVLGALPNPNYTIAYFYTQPYMTSNTNPGAVQVQDPTHYSNQVAEDDTLWVVVTNTATAAPCRAIVSVPVHVEKKATPFITTTSGSNTLCVEWGSNLLMNGLTLDSGISGANYTYIWFLDGVALPGATSATYSITTNAPGNYTVQVISTTALGCPSAISNVFTVVTSGPAVAIGSGYIVTEAFIDQTIIINVEGYGSGSYQYSLDDGPFQSSPVFNNVFYGEHTVVVHDTKGTTSCGDLTITPVQTIDYPHYFTPNGDGIQDTWNIPGLNSQVDSKIFIFDRNGKLLKEISPAGDGWNGMYNGNMMPSSDYWFTVEYKNQNQEAKVFKAHFALKR